MKSIRLIAVGIFLAAITTVSAFAQGTTPASPSKIGIIDTGAFGDSKEGITKYIAAANQINTEFKPAVTELQNLGTRIENLEKELTVLQDQANKGTVPIDRNAANAKAEEYDKLKRDYKFKEEDLKAKIDRRQQAVLIPIMQDIYKAAQDYAKQKGFTMIIDITKDDKLLFMALDEKADITKDFITFYNARPATTATTAPKPAGAATKPN